MQYQLLPRALPISAVCGAPALLSLLAVTFAAPLDGGPGQKPDSDRELATARALAERWGGGINDPARGWVLAVGIDARTARRLEPVLTVRLEGPEVGDRELA